MLVCLQKTVKTFDERTTLVFKREIKIPIEPIIGFSITGLEEEDSDDAVNHIVYNCLTKKLTLIMEESYYNSSNIDSIGIILHRHSKWELVNEIHTD